MKYGTKYIDSTQNNELRTKAMEKSGQDLQLATPPSCWLHVGKMPLQSSRYLFILKSVLKIINQVLFYLILVSVYSSKVKINYYNWLLYTTTYFQKLFFENIFTSICSLQEFFVDILANK